MKPNSKQLNDYATGADMWNDTVLCYGIDESITICRNYLDLNLKREHSEYERQYCRELLSAMYDATANRTVKAEIDKFVYPYDFEVANKRLETSYYHTSRQHNAECAKGIDNLINASCYGTNHYNLETAAMKAIVDYGFTRVNMILSFNIQQCEHDGRFSSANKRWAKEFSIPEKVFNNSWLHAHPTLIDDFCMYIRKYYIDLKAEHFKLPGHEEHGDYVQGYEIIRAIKFDDKQGYAIGYNSTAVNPYVCWQFVEREGERSYNWGAYGEQQTAIDNYTARILVHIN